MKIEILRSTSAIQPYYARIVASNGKVLFTSETYHSYQDAYNAAYVVKTQAHSAPIV